MLRKELLIQYLKELIEVIEHGDDDLEVMKHIRSEGFFFPFWEKEMEYQFRRLEQKIDKLLERPVHSCQMISNEENDSLQLMIKKGMQEKAISYLYNQFREAKELIICDPYFLQPSGSFNINLAIPNSVTSIELYVKPGSHDTEIISKLKDFCRGRNINLKCWETGEIHDRVWIADWDRAYVVGTSFNGLGNKLAFILKLPDNDKSDFIEELHSLKQRMGCPKPI